MGKSSEILKTILERRSCRSFHPDPIPENHIEQMVQSLRWAPSAGNRQPWHFYLVRNGALKEKLVSAAFGQTFLGQAPLVFVVCAIPQKSADRYGDRGRKLYVYQDTAAAVQNLLLTATGLGYGSCWVGAFDEQAVRETLQLPDDFRPVSMVPIGKPTEKLESSTRFSVKDILTIID